MTEIRPDPFEPTPDWPAGLFAVMQNGDGTPEYYRPWQPQQELGEFINQVARIAVKGIVSYPYTAFNRVISSETGETDEAITILVDEAITKQKESRATLG